MMSTASDRLTSHSQTTKTRHPRLSSSIRFLRSRRIFSESFDFQNSTLDLGSAALWQSLCLCQKQPFPKITPRHLCRAPSAYCAIWFLCETPRSWTLPTTCLVVALASLEG